MIICRSLIIVAKKLSRKQAVDSRPIVAVIVKLR